MLGGRDTLREENLSVQFKNLIKKWNCQIFPLAHIQCDKHQKMPKPFRGTIGTWCMSKLSQGMGLFELPLDFLAQNCVIDGACLNFSQPFGSCKNSYEPFKNSEHVLSSYRGSKSAMAFRESGLLRSLSSRLTMSPKRGRLERSCSQHCNISWYTAEGQSIGAGRRKASLMAFIT